MSYKIYTIRKEGLAEALPIAFLAPTDADAVKEAKKRLEGQDLEVRQGTRVVAYLVADK